MYAYTSYTVQNKNFVNQQYPPYYEPYWPGDHNTYHHRSPYTEYNGRFESGNRPYLIIPPVPHHVNPSHWQTSMLSHPGSHNHTSLTMPAPILTSAGTTMSTHRLKPNPQHSPVCAAQYDTSQHDYTVQHQQNRQLPLQVNISLNDISSSSQSHTGTSYEHSRPFSMTNHANPSSTMPYDLRSQLSSRNGQAQIKITN